jgi:hypothetical protein
MLCKKLIVGVLAVVGGAPFFSLAHAQKRSVFDMDERMQKEFIGNFLSSYSPESSAISDDPAGTSSQATFENQGDTHFADAIWIVRQRNWAVEMVLQKIKAVRSLPKHDGYTVFLLTQILVYSDRPDVLEIISSRLKDDPDFEDLIRSTMSHSISGPNEDMGRMWYRALESDNPVVRTVAKKYLAPVFIDPPPPYSRAWASVLVDRYGHSPTALEMATDPIFLVAKERNPEKAERTRAMMLSLTEKEYLRRQLPTPVKPQ